MFNYFAVKFKKPSFMRRFTTQILVVLALFLVSSPSVAQEQEQAPVTLDEKFTELKSSSETYEQFKVITTTELDSFWGEVQDSLSVQKQTIEELEFSETAAKSEAEEQRNAVNELNTALENARSNTTTITFLGADVQKSTYHLVVWLIILVLLVLCVVVWFTSKSGSSQAKQAREAYDAVNAELENAKNKARETQMKLKRELQTALNQLEELKRRSK